MGGEHRVKVKGVDFDAVVFQDAHIVVGVVGGDRGLPVLRAAFKQGAQAIQDVFAGELVAVLVAYRHIPGFARRVGKGYADEFGVHRGLGGGFGVKGDDVGGV